MAEFVSLYVTAADDTSAKKLARELLERHLIACANVFPMQSLFRWEGGVQEEPEVGMILKTTRDRTDAAVAAVEELHDYDVPCAVAWPIDAGHPPYLDWVREETTAPE